MGEGMIARVFPRRTKASPNDALAFFGPPSMFLPEIDEVHVSVAFTWDIPKGELLARQWEAVAPVKTGGPAFNQPGNGFIPGRYLKQGYTITSRGCPNRCWFCSVWKREPGLKELEVQFGNDILDDNLLACSESHIREVFAMLSRQKERARFTGGIEAKRLKPWHLELFRALKPSPVLFMAYDTKDDLEPLIEASKMFKEIKFTRHQLRCYVLIGYPGDTFQAATERLQKTLKLGCLPMAMLYRDKTYKRETEWTRFQRQWVRPKLIAKRIKQNDQF